MTNIVGNNIENSRDLVQFWMEKVCGFVGDRHKMGIFVRKQQSLEEIVGNLGKPFYLRSGDYLQVTSPLRKIVDLVNSICVAQPSLLPKVENIFIDFDTLELKRKRTKKVVKMDVNYYIYCIHMVRLLATLNILKMIITELQN